MHFAISIDTRSKAKQQPGTSAPAELNLYMIELKDWTNQIVLLSNRT